MSASGAGRRPCDNCGSFHTERKRSGVGNTKVLECRDCGEEVEHHTGPECPDCGSQNSERKVEGVVPHKTRFKQCYECGNKWDITSGPL